MSNIQIMNQASKLMKSWTAEGEKGIFIDYYVMKTGNQIDSKEYSIVYDMLMDGLL